MLAAISFEEGLQLLWVLFKLVFCVVLLFELHSRWSEDRLIEQMRQKERADRHASRNQPAAEEAGTQSSE